MKKLVFAAGICFLFSCKKSTPQPAPAPLQILTHCTIRSISYFGSNSGNHNDFYYDGSGKMNLYKTLMPDNEVVATATLAGVTDSAIGSASYTALAQFSSSGEDQTANNTFSFNGRTGQPTAARVDLIGGHFGITASDYQEFLFGYNAKGLLIHVEEHTPNIVDDEWTVDVTYNDSANVTRLDYSWSTGPRTVTSVFVTSFDNKPNPFSGQLYWKFIQGMFWNAPDPTPVIVALSRNNPTGITYSNTAIITLTYSYNDKGLPSSATERDSALTANYVGVTSQTYEYNCP